MFVLKGYYNKALVYYSDCIIEPQLDVFLVIYSSTTQNAYLFKTREEAEFVATQIVENKSFKIYPICPTCHSEYNKSKICPACGTKEARFDFINSSKK